MKIKKQHINELLLTLSSYDPKNGLPLGGLLFEELGLGIKRKLQKIRKELLIHGEDLNIDLKAVQESESTDKEQEIKELMEEEVTLTADFAMISEIEKLETKNNYDFDLIELIAK